MAINWHACTCWQDCSVPSGHALQYPSLQMTHLGMIALRSGRCPDNCKPPVNLLLCHPGETAHRVASPQEGFACDVLVSIAACMINHLTMLSVHQDAEGDACGGQVSNLTNSSHKLMRWLMDYGELMRYCITLV